MPAQQKILYIVNEAYFFLSHRLAVARTAVAEGFEVHVAAPEDHVWAPAGFSVEAIEEAGFHYHPIALSRRGTRPLEELATFLAIWRLLRSLRPDLVHTLTIKPVLYGGIAARLAGVRGLVNAVTGLGQIFGAKGWRAAMLRLAVSRLYGWSLGHGNARLIVQNPDDGDILVRLGAVKAEGVELIRGSGVDLAQFAFSPDPGGEPVFVLPARLIWDKGIQEFVDAAALLRQRGVTARFALIGDTHPSNPRAVPEATLRGFAAEGVEWWGRCDDMPAIFASVHAVVLPSNYREGVPKVLIEAAASGRPIVATDNPGCREIARHEENALLVPPRDAAALAAALARLAKDPALRRRLGQGGRRIAEAEFDENQVAARTLEIYRRLLLPGAAKA